jgi:hypothetical protein
LASGLYHWLKFLGFKVDICLPTHNALLRNNGAKWFAVVVDAKSVPKFKQNRVHLKKGLMLVVIRTTKYASNKTDT